MAPRPASSLGHVFSENSAFMKAARKKSKAMVLQRMQPVAVEVAAQANRLTNEKYQIRSADRRRTGGPHVVGSFYCVVKDGGKGDMSLILRSRAKKETVAYLNYGTERHVIVAHGRRGKTGRGKQKGLRYPRSPRRDPDSAYFTPSPYAAIHAKGGGAMTRKKFVKHPGNAPGMFLQEAMELGVRKALNRSVHLSRQRKTGVA